MPKRCEILGTWFLKTLLYIAELYTGWQGVRFQVFKEVLQLIEYYTQRPAIKNDMVMSQQKPPLISGLK